MENISSKQLQHYFRDIIRQYNNYFQEKLGSIPGILKKSNEDHYCFIPSSNVTKVLNTLHRIYITEFKQLSNAPKFLDCGCGIGNIILLAQAIGYNAYGIEYEEDTCKVAKKLTKRADEWGVGTELNKIAHDDVMTFEHYADYDVIYYFEPIKKPTKRAKFHEKLANDVKTGSIVYSYTESDYFDQHPKFVHLFETYDYGVYKKIKK